MKGHMFCASQASTAICLSTDHVHKPNTSSAEERGDGGRAIDRHNPVIKEVGRRSFTVAPCSSVDDVPYILLQKTKMPSTAGDVNSIRKLHKGRKSSAVRSSGSGGGTAASLFKLIADDISLGRKSLSCSRAVPGSSRYLLGSDPDSVSGSLSRDSVSGTSEPKRGSDDAVQEGESEKKTSSSSSEQVVVLRVSLHCKGCEAKVRKHLSRMQGVTSFNIDFTSKKVTVTGDITPLEVLASISKIKSAQFWTSSLPNANLETSEQ
ncbi:PREDICTED: protein SODIUM POTASSIUM ROOT DEFECTIVE 2-like [Tarenaya hassleriana]|uniref:protein SODIUM POTASSIUM ROOT DEFECTIVE 2-like n=1 Tax=Tarenaya hassleriana TaxID=28532 RepID=UPI00053C6ED0|nr:PREDICTED: protein SODIUM POTASSIUM ROOT DEFECTIVE 2-like [Tarenaya hassleriana]